MSVGAAVECVWQAKAVLGEGPCWDARSDTVFWVDIKGKRLHAFASDEKQRTWTPPHRVFSLDVPPSSWTPPATSAHWFVGCTAAGFSWIGVADDEILVQALAHPESDYPENRETGESDRIDTGYIVSNGPAFSPDGGTLYHTDSARRLIYAFDLAANGAVSSRRVFMRFDEEDGYPDGMTTDRAGNLWIAMWDGARLQQLSPRGERLAHVPLPTARPTSCAFAGADQSVLMVTSASLGLPATDELAGALFRVTLG
jgi:D-xylonolactonase